MQRAEDRFEISAVLGAKVLIACHGDGSQGGGEERDRVCSCLSVEGQSFQQFEAREERCATGFGEEDRHDGGACAVEAGALVMQFLDAPCIRLKTVPLV